MNAQTKGAFVKTALLTGVLSLGITGTTFLTAKPAAAQWCPPGHYETQQVWIPGHEQPGRWVPGHWMSEAWRTWYYPGHWEAGYWQPGHYTTREVWIPGCVY